MSNLYPYQKQALSALFNCSESEIEESFTRLKDQLMNPEQHLLNQMNKAINSRMSLIIDGLILDELRKKIEPKE